MKSVDNISERRMERAEEKILLNASYLDIRHEDAYTMVGDFMPEKLETERTDSFIKTMGISIKHPESHAVIEPLGFLRDTKTAFWYGDTKVVKDDFRDHIFYYIDQMISIVGNARYILLGNFEYNRLEQYLEPGAFKELKEFYVKKGSNEVKERVKTVTYYSYKALPVYQSEQEFLVDVR